MTLPFILLLSAVLPVGLWQSKEEGFVIRIAAGAPKAKRDENPKEICGKQMLRDFVWNPKHNRWEGHMQPPNTSMNLNATVTTDGKTVLVLKAKMMLISKTLSFIPFTGQIAEGCRLP
jgi:hypothetical protein